MKSKTITCLFPVFFFLSGISYSQEPVDDYDFSFPKIKFNPVQPPAAGLTFKITHTEKTDRLTSENLDAVSTLADIDLKYSRKSPDVTFFYNVSGITVSGMKTITENGKYFKEISYTIKNAIEFIGKDGTTFNNMAMEDGTRAKTIKAGSNFFRQLSLQNRKYPKPADIPNIDASAGYVPSWEETFQKPVPSGFATQAELDAFVNKYNNYLLAKSEALAVETEFSNNSALLEVLFGRATFREDFAVAMVRQKKRPFNYDDFDKAGEMLKSAYKVFSVNIADTAAYYPLLRDVVKTYTDIQKTNEQRVHFEIIQSIIDHNISLANAFLLNIDEAILYAGKFSANKRSAPIPVQLLYRTIDFMKKRAVAKKGYSDNLLAKISKAQ